MVPNSEANAWPHNPAPAAYGQECELCGSRRLNGGSLASRAGLADSIVWVCADCQHKLAIRVDDEGVLGG